MGSAEESPGSEVATSVESTLQDVEKHGVLSTDKTPGGDEEQWKRPVGRLVWFQVCVGIILSAMLYGLDTTIAADVQASVIQSLGQIEKISWVGIGFPMGSVATILLIGSCYGIFNVKWIYLGGIILFEVGSAVCGAAPTMDALIVGRVIAGIGGASMALTWGVGCILGPVVGGEFSVSSATWRWAFYINLVLAAITAPIYIFSFPSLDPRPELSHAEKWLKVDWVGAFLKAAFIILLMVALNFAGPTWRWGSGGTIALWVLFGVTLITFIVQQTFSIFTTSETRLFPVQFLKNRGLILTYIASAAANACVFIPIYFVPLFFQFTKDDSAIQAAVRLLPFITVVIFFIMFSGALLPVFPYYSAWYFVSGIFLLIGSPLMFTVTPTTKTAAVYGFEIIISIGAGLGGQIGYTIAASKVKPHEVPAAIGFINVSQIGTIALALAISGNIFQNLGFKRLQAALAAYDFTEVEIRSALAGTQSKIFQNGSDEVKTLAVNSVSSTISSLYGLSIAAGALILVVAVLMKREKLQMNLAVAG
ncbi:hypothetical protein TCE0_013f00969 [Talaromyces pinophilus]|uniref:Major facilitator superfamily (MFS) profile domain-containing protein n=1 Tax=Talaromyces pinophilus TaxID=128442 RepID=A0A698XPR4_TALPI|nr:hypothetical protein TCE0_013f00969 [Talaromyces pinophilus]